MSEIDKIRLAVYNPLMSDTRWVVGSFRSEETCRALSSVGIEGIIASPFIKEERRIAPSFSVIPLPRRMLARTKTFTEVVRHGEYDIVQERPIAGGITWNGCGLVASLCHRLPFVLELHNMGPDLNHLKRLPVHIASVRHSSLVLAYSRMKGVLLLGVTPGKILEIPNGYSSDTVDSVLGSERRVIDLDETTGGRKAFGFFGTLSKDKCVDLILKVADILAEYRDICVVLAGAGPMERLVNEQSNRENSNVVFLGLLDRRKTLACMAQCRATFALSDPDQSQVGNPVKVVESLAMGVLPITTSDYIMPMELKEHCYVLDSRNPREIANAVLRISSSDHERHFPPMIEKFSIERIARDILLPAYGQLVR